MNRRGFIGSMLKACAAAMALPSAVTYARKWVATEGEIILRPLRVGACNTYSGQLMLQSSLDIENLIREDWERRILWTPFIGPVRGVLGVPTYQGDSDIAEIFESMES